MTEIVNKAGKLTLEDENSGYDKEFHSSQGSSGSTGSMIDPRASIFLSSPS
jgi:hypothetical protein